MSEDLPEKKVCLGVCGKELPLGAFGKSRDGKYGRLSRCKVCRAQEEKERRAANPSTEDQKEEAAQRTRDWYAANRDRALASSAKWAKDHPEATAVTRRKYRSKPEVRSKLREANRVWFKENPEKARAASRNWRASHPEKMRELYQAWAASNRERVRELNRKWHAEHPEHDRSRYELIRNSGFTFDQWLEILAEFNYQCVYCGRDDVELTMDHVIAVSNGGLHTKDNLVPSCRPCNSRKGAKDPSLFKFVVQRAQAHKDTETGA